MTNTDYRLKYPIGTKIIYMPCIDIVTVAALKDIGKQGTVIEYCGCQVNIFLPTSLKMSKTWRTVWGHIKPLVQKNQQLVFSFAYEV